MGEEEECPDCWGEIEMERIGEFRSQICTVCGLVVESEHMAEYQENMEEEGVVEEL